MWPGYRGESERADGRKFLVPNEVFTGVPIPLGVLALLYPLKEEGAK